MPRGVGVRVPLSAQATVCWQSLFFVRIKALGQLVAPRQTCLWSVVVCCANIRACCAIVSENKFSPHRPSTPTIFDCNNLPSVCSRLLPPVESWCYDSIICHDIAQATVCWQSLFFVRINGLGQLVAMWQCSLRLSNVQSRCATLKYRLRNICSNKFGIYSQPIFQTFGFSAHSSSLALLKPAATGRVLLLVR